MWLLFFLDNIVPKPKGEVLEPHEIETPPGNMALAILGGAIAVAAVLAVPFILAILLG